MTFPSNHNDLSTNRQEQSKNLEFRPDRSKELSPNRQWFSQCYFSKDLKFWPCYLEPAKTHTIYSRRQGKHRDIPKNIKVHKENTDLGPHSFSTLHLIFSIHTPYNFKFFPYISFSLLNNLSLTDHKKVKHKLKWKSIIYNKANLGNNALIWGAPIFISKSLLNFIINPKQKQELPNWDTCDLSTEASPVRWQ